MAKGPVKKSSKPGPTPTGPLKPVRVTPSRPAVKVGGPVGGRPQGRPGGPRKPPFGSKGLGPFDRRPPKPLGYTRQLNIVHEDADILVVDKPPGVLTANMPGEDRESLFDQVKDYVKSSRRTRKPVKVWIIHRLDKEASGLLVFAKSEKAFHWLKEDFKAKRIKRLYSAVVEGLVGGGPKERQPALPAGTVQSFITEDEFGNTRSLGVGETARHTGAEARRERWVGKRAGGPRHPGEVPDKPQLAVTHYRVLGYGNGRTLVQLRLETGRKNQIRLHMKELGHPIIGDRRFGATNDPIQRTALHATDLGFTHPTTGESVRYVSPAPASFFRAVGMQPPAASETTREPAAAPDAKVRQRAAAETSWDEVALWYDQLVEEGRSDHFDQVIVPGTLRLLRPLAGMRVLDIACGQGHLCRKLAELGVSPVGVDASPRLIEAAKARSEGLSLRFEEGDARSLDGPALGGPFDAVTCIMALMNIDPLEPVLRGAASALAPGGTLVFVILHPAFRAPGQTSWGWDAAGGGRQFRRVDGYLSTGQTPITMNPGYAAHGAEAVQTWTFHRPLQAYSKALAEAGFVIETIEEWPSLRVSQPGPRAVEENRARREIPMFLGVRAVKRGE
ncbi:MAG: methyltransferase domain-containing protein [Phycisphaeraceae bacterium]|nr:methyltransferase domain-containing protein [Phycisphaeraceae bacterium]